MNLQELGAFLMDDVCDLLRVEALDWYDSASDDPHYTRWLQTGHVEVDDRWQAWLDHIAAETNGGMHWRRVHVIVEPLSEYLRFEFGVQYALNADAGEQIRILTVPASAIDTYRDFFVVNYGRKVALSHYDADNGRFTHADDVSADSEYWADIGEKLWAEANPYEQWWANHPQYHQRRQAA